MSPWPAPSPRFRVGRISVYPHHGAWWIYYRDGGAARSHRPATIAERVAAVVDFVAVGYEVHLHRASAEAISRLFLTRPGGLHAGLPGWRAHGIVRLIGHRRCREIDRTQPASDPTGRTALVGIQHQVLGAPGRDNSLLARAWTGRAMYRLLFDCGEGCLSTLSAAEVRAIDALFFSHLHIDHVAGFDAFLRLNFARPDAPVLIFGPAGTARAIHHRLLGVTWNLIAGQPGEVRVADVRPDRLVATRFLTAEAFEHAHPAGEMPFEGLVYEAEGLTVEARIMDHGIPCLAYAVRERPRTNVDVTALATMGLKPGRWIQGLKDPSRGDDEEVVTDAGTHRLGELRRRLLVSTPGSCLAYLTDFGLDERAERELVEWLRGCAVIVGEASYRDVDAELARRHRHFTGSAMGRLAAAVGARQLVLFHLSDRYSRDDWMGLLAEVRRVFPAAGFPSHWGLESNNHP